MSDDEESVPIAPRKREIVMSDDEESGSIVSRKRPSTSTEEDDTPFPPKRGRSPVIEKVYKFKGSWKSPKCIYKIKGGFDQFGSPFYEVDGCPGLEYCIYTMCYGVEQTVVGGLLLQYPKDHNVQADHTVTIPSAGFSNKVNCLYDEEVNGKSFIICNSAADICKSSPQYFKNGWMKIVVEGTFKLIPKEKKPLFTVNLTNVKEELYAAEYSLPADVLIVEGRRIKVHKLLLLQKFSNINEFFNSDACEFEINDHPYEIVKVAVAFAHGYPLPTLKVQELIQLSKFVQQYGYGDLKNTIDSTFVDMIDQSNIHELAALSVTMDAPELKQLCMTYLDNARNNGNPNGINFRALHETFFDEWFIPASTNRVNAAASSTTMNTSNGPNARVKPEPVETPMVVAVKQEDPENPTVAASDVPNN